MTGGTSDTRTLRATQLIEKAQYGEAQRVLTAVLDENPDDAVAWHLFGTASYRAGDLDGAERAFRRRLALVPDDPVAHYSLAIALRDRGRTHDAIRGFHHALALNPDFKPARDRLAELEPPKPAPPPPPVPRPEDPTFPVATPEEVIGIATTVRIRMVPDPWLGRGQLTVLTFRVTRQDAAGDPLPPVSIEMRGAEIDGDLLEGDPVHVPGEWRRGRPMKPRTVINLRTLEHIHIRHGTRTVQLLIVAAFVLGFLAFVVVAATNIR